jgi:hypothetical protein
MKPWLNLDILLCERKEFERCVPKRIIGKVSGCWPWNGGA